MHLENLRNVRRSRNLSQSQLGSRIGVQQPRVAMIEGGASVTRETAERIAGALLCDVEDLIKPEEPTITLKLSDIPPQMMRLLTK
jgi:transcriptional regulator with XRE-family HTH domain